MREEISLSGAMYPENIILVPGRKALWQRHPPSLLADSLLLYHSKDWV